MEMSTSTGQLVAKNTFIQIAGKFVSTLLGLAVIAIVTRSIGPDGYGHYTTVITFLSFFGVIADFGLTLITAQMISQPDADESRIVSSIFTFRLVTALVLFALAPVAAYFTDYPATIKLGIALTSWSFFFVSLQQTLVGIFQKHLVMGYPVVAENIGRVALFAGTVYAAWSGSNLLWFLGAVVIGNIFNFIATFIFVRRFIALRLAWDTHIIRDMIIRATPIAISIIFNLVYLKADTLILSFQRPIAEVGFYGVAYRVIDILMMIPVMMMGVILPIATAAWVAGDHERISRILQKTFDAFLIFALPILLGGLLVAEPLMILVGGKDFAPSAAPLRILLGAFFAATFSTFFGHAIVALQKQRNVIWVYGVDAVLSLIAYLIFIPRFGMTGAGWSTFGSELFAAVILGIIVLQTTRTRLSARVVPAVLVGCIVMLLVVVTLESLPVLIVLVAGAAVYGAVMYAARVHKMLL